MSGKEYKAGDLVVFVAGDWRGHAGIVSWPVSESSAGHVLVYSDGRVAGPPAAYADLRPADEASHGYTQLAYCLIKLASHVIEKAILPITR